MIVVIFVVIVIVRPPLGMALKETVMPTASMDVIFPAILTLLGGTVGGYITFSGAHRLIDAGITKKENLKEINKSSVMGIGIATIVRVFLFLAILGVGSYHIYRRMCIYFSVFPEDIPQEYRET